MDTDQIIHVLLSNIGEYKTFRTTTVDVFLEDPQYYHQMIQQKRIDEECQKVSLFSKHWLIRHRYRSGMRRMLDTDLLA